MTLLVAWTICTVFGMSLYAVCFIWAVRSRQFTELDRQRYIALDVDDSVPPEQKDLHPGRLDRYTWIFIVLLAAAVCSSAAWLAVFGR